MSHCASAWGKRGTVHTCPALLSAALPTTLTTFLQEWGCSCFEFRPNQ